MLPILYRAASLSPCGRYRNDLVRGWSPEFGRYALWIMLNPSTADGEQDDATILNICERTQDYGLPWFGRSHCLRKPEPQPANLFEISPAPVGLMVGNLYAWRETDPFHLWAAHVEGEDIIGPQNDAHLQRMIGAADTIMCAWGNGSQQLARERFHRERAGQVLAMIAAAGKPAWMLERCKSGHPRHPLYFPMRGQPERFEALT